MLYEVITQLAEEEQLPRFTASLMGSFGGLSLFLAALGIYGVLAQTVAVQRREIGLRTALGAPPSSVVQIFVAGGRSRTSSCDGWPPVRARWRASITSLMVGSATSRMMSSAWPTERTAENDTNSIV